MPRMIGKTLPEVRQENDNLCAIPGYTRIQFAQAAKLRTEDLLCSLDTTDKGGPNRRAKRWFRWFGKMDAVLKLGTASALRRVSSSNP